MVRLLVVALFFLVCLNAVAQYNITGKIIDDEGGPLTGANIYLPEFQIGTSSDQEGNIRFG